MRGAMKRDRYSVAFGAFITLGVTDLGLLDFWALPKVMGAPPALEATRAASPDTRPPEDPVTPSATPPPERAPGFTILFGVGRVKVGASDGASLAQLAKDMVTHPEWSIAVDGHAD